MDCKFNSVMSLAKGRMSTCAHCGLQAKDIVNDQNSPEECRAAAHTTLSQYLDRLNRVGRHRTLTTQRHSNVHQR